MNDENNEQAHEEEIIEDIKNPLQEQIDDLNEKNAKLNQTCMALSQTLDMSRMRNKTLESEIQNTILQEKLKMTRLVIKTLDLLNNADLNIHNMEEILKKNDEVEGLDVAYDELAGQIRNFINGLIIGRSEILVAVKEQGIQRFECNPGDEITPEFNVVEIVHDSEIEPNKIVKVKSAGYFLMHGERKVIIRAPEVSVAGQE